MSEEPKNDARCDAGQLEVGDKLSRIQYYTVLEHDEEKALFTVENEQGFKFKVTSGIIEAEMHSASQFAREEKVTRTELVEKLENARDTCFTVVFRKQLTDKLLADKLFDLSEVDLGDGKARRKFARELLTGTERRLTGYLLNAEPRLGRTLVVDLEVEPGKHNIRMVDHRTISEMIYKNVRYYC